MFHRCIVLLIAALVATSNAQTTIPVPTATHPTIQSAVNAAASGDTILIAPGTYFENVDLLGKNLTLLGSGGATACAIDGGLLGPVIRQTSAQPGTRLEGLTIRNGSDANGAGILASDLELEIVGCELTGNRATGFGGALYLTNSAGLTVEDSGFTMNTSGNAGGAIWSDCGNLTIERTSFNGNGAGDVGGAVRWAGDGVRIVDSVFSLNTALRAGGACSLTAQIDVAVGGTEATGNTVSVGVPQGLLQGGAFAIVSGLPARFTSCKILANSIVGSDPSVIVIRGGGISNDGGGLVIVDSEIRGNTISGTSVNGAVLVRGGGIYSDSGTTFSTDISRCIISDNCATAVTTLNAAFCDGGGLQADGDELTIKSTVISGNVVTQQGLLQVGGGHGGGVHTLSSSLIMNSTIVLNSASTFGGGVTGGTLVINSIVRGNTPNELDGTGQVDFSDVLGGWAGPGTGNIDADPLFANPATGDFHITAGSPCIDAGGTTIFAPLPPLDIDGQPRPLDGGPDMGADEFPGSPFLDPACAAGTTGITSGGPYDTLFIDGSDGGPARRVVIPVGQPFTFEVMQPPTQMAPALFYIAGYIGVAGPLQVTPLPFGIGTLCIPLLLIDPNAPGAFVVASSFGPDPNALVPSTPAPWSLPIGAIPFPFALTFQGMIQDGSPTIRTTNAILVDVQ